MSYQCVIIEGNLGGDPETRYLSNGDAVSSFSVAVSEQWKDSSGERKEKTEWFKVVAFKQLAEIAGQYLSKGKAVLVQGKMQTRSYETQGGERRYVTELRADVIRMIGPRQDAEQGAGRNQGNGQQRQQRTNGYENGQQRGQRTQQRQQQGGGFDEMDDDIPFAPPYRGMQLLSCM